MGSRTVGQRHRNREWRTRIQRRAEVQVNRRNDKRTERWGKKKGTGGRRDRKKEWDREQGREMEKKY